MDNEEQDQYSYPQMIISQRFTTLQEVKEHVEKSNEYLHLLEFKKKGTVLNVTMLAISTPLLKFLHVLGESLPEKRKALINSPEKGINKALFDWVTRLGRYLDATGDIEGAIKFEEIMRLNHSLSMQDKHPLPLRICLKIQLPDDTPKYINGLMSSEFIVIKEEERLINLSRTDIEEITEEEYNYRLKEKRTVYISMNYEEMKRRRNIENEKGES